jgi:hypothetical protein
MTRVNRNITIQFIMKKYLFVLAVGLVAQFGSSSLIETSGRCADAAAEAAPAKIYTAAETDGFKKLAQETLAALAADKKDEMVAKLTDLETAWDDQEKNLRPKDESTWTALDKTLDQAISALRSSHKNLEKGKAALEDLIKKLEQATKA